MTETSSVSFNLRMWNSLGRAPLGSWIFTKALCLKAPYFRTIKPTIVELGPGVCSVEAPNRWRVHNHIGTFHAIAACNMAELAAGLMTDSTVPSTHRWIPKGMTVEYRAKATTDLKAVARLDHLPSFSAEPVEIVVPVTITDKRGETVVAAEITMYVSPKRT